MEDNLILVDLDDNVIGKETKLIVHQKGLLHRAFSVFNISDNMMLLQKRSIKKYHSGGKWANACCSHPRYGENLIDSVNRRLKEELNMQTHVQEMFNFVYRTVFENGLIEYELDHVFLCSCTDKIMFSDSEIEKVAWVDIEEIKKDIIKHPELYAPWFVTAFPKVIKSVEV